MRSNHIKRYPPTTVRILVIDDEDAVRDLTTTILEKAGYTVIAAANATDGLNSLSSMTVKPLLALLDMTLPDMGCEELCQRISETNPDTRIVIVSGNSRDEAAKIYPGVRSYGFIHKPFTVNAFLEQVKFHLDL